MITRLNMLILMEHNFEAAISFYESLGFKKVFALDNRWAEFDLNGVKIGLCPTSHVHNEGVRTGIVFEVDDIQAAYNICSKQGAALGEIIEKIHGKMVSVKDPSNNIIDLYQPTPERLRDLIEKVKSEDGKSACSKESNCCKKGGSKADKFC